MLDIAVQLDRWCARERDFAVATVSSVTGSAPRQPGAALAVDTTGAAVGSVSGGCVEGAVYELCQQALETGETSVRRFGYSDQDALATGLTCGGAIEVLITPVFWNPPTARRGHAGTPAADPRTLALALAAAARREPVAVARVVGGPAWSLGATLLTRPGGAVAAGTLGGTAELDRTAAAEAAAMLERGRGGTVLLGAAGRRSEESLTLLVESSLPPPSLLVFGAVEFARALVRVGTLLGYRSTVCDARPVFATADRFPEADEVVVDWPHRYLDRHPVDARTVLCALTHDTKFDVPLLTRALRSPAGYVGAMGSRRTHLDRSRRLREAGLTERELSRLRSPIGLDLGARTPTETALSIAAEIVAELRGGSGASLTGGRTPIHHDGPDARAAAPDSWPAPAHGG